LAIAGFLASPRYPRVTCETYGSSFQTSDFAPLRFGVGLHQRRTINLRKENAMSRTMPRTMMSLAAAALIGIACVSTDALARGGRGVGRAGHVGGIGRTGGVGRVGGVHGAYRGGYAGRGWGVGVGAAAVGAAAVGAAAAGPYYNRAACGYAPYPPCY
jgi:hypothetical protein